MDQPPPVPETQSPPSALPTVPTTSLPARLLNVFATPSDVFDEVKAAPKSSVNWLAPALVSVVVGIFAAYVMFSQPAIVQKLKEQQEARFEVLVQKGQMSQADADKVEGIFGSPAVLTVAASVVYALMSFIRVFGWAFVLWLLSRLLLKRELNYMKTAEITGLASMIAVLGMIVTMLLTVNLGRMGASPSLALTIGDFDPNSKTHLLLGAVNIVNFWEVAIMGLGLSRLAGVRFARAAFLVFAFWVIFALLAIAVGMGAMAL